MTYRERLELYSQGKLSEQEIIEIEKELEKQEALSDYLFEHQAPPGMDDLFENESGFDSESMKGISASVSDDSKDVAKQINGAIRRAFIKTGVIAAAVAVILTLFIVFALPHIVSAFYYDPAKVVATDDNGNAITQLESDLSVYAELAIPEIGPEIRVGTNGYGYGNYSYYIDSQFQVDADQKWSINNTFTGIIKRDSFLCYNYEDFMSYNNWSGYFDGGSDDISKMDQNRPYYAYVTFNETIPYGKFYDNYVQIDKYGTNGSWVWCGIQLSSEEKSDYHKNLGFYATSGGNISREMFDEEEYPGLAWSKGYQDLETEEQAIEYFGSITKYLKDNEQFLGLDDQLGSDMETEELDEASTFVSSNGVNVYGFIYVSDKEHIEALSKAPNVKGISVVKAE